MSVPLASPSPTTHLYPHTRHTSPAQSPRASRFATYSPAGQASRSSSQMASASPSWARPPAASTSKAAWTRRRRCQTENSSADEADEAEQRPPPARHHSPNSELGDVNPFANAGETKRVIAQPRRPPLNRLPSGGKPPPSFAHRALEDHFAQVSMTPPASFGSQTHTESPFGGTAALSHPATDLRNPAAPAARLPRTTSSFASAFEVPTGGMRRTTRLESARAGDVRKFGRLNDADEGSSSSGDERKWGQASPSVYAAKQGRLRRGEAWPARHARSKTSDASDSSVGTAVAQRRGKAPPTFLLTRKEPSDTQLTLRTRMDLDDQSDDEMGAPPSPSPPSASLSSVMDAAAPPEPLLQPGPILGRRSSASATSGRRQALDDGEGADEEDAPDSAPPSLHSFPRPNTSPTLTGAPAKMRHAVPPSTSSTVSFPQPILGSVPMKTSKSTSSSSSSPYKAKRRVTISDRGARTRAVSSVEDQLSSSSFSTSPSPFINDARKRSGSAARHTKAGGRFGGAEDASFDDSGIGLGFFAPQSEDSSTPFRKGELLLSHRLGFDDTPEKGVLPDPARSPFAPQHRKSTSVDSLNGNVVGSSSTPAKQVRRGANPFGPITKSSLANETRFSMTPGGTDSGASSPDVREQLAEQQLQYQHQQRTTSVPEGLAAGVETPAYLTPQNFKHIKPLQAAFMSTGLVSKRARGPPTEGDVVPVPPRPNFGADSSFGNVSMGAGNVTAGAANVSTGDTSVGDTSTSSLPAGTMAAAMGLRDVVAATARRASLGGPTSTMPDTPVKKPVGAGVGAPGSLAHHLMGGGGGGARAGAATTSSKPRPPQPPPSVLRPTASAKPSMLAAEPMGRTLSTTSTIGTEGESPLLGGACDSPTLNMMGGAGGSPSLVATSQFSTLPKEHAEEAEIEQPKPRPSVLLSRAPLRRVKTNAAPVSTVSAPPVSAATAGVPSPAVKKATNGSTASHLAPRPAAARSLSDNIHHHRRSRLGQHDPSTSDSEGSQQQQQRIIPTARTRFPRDPTRPALGLQRKASFGVGSGNSGGLGLIDGLSSADTGSAAAAAALSSSTPASPTLGGFWPIPSTPTRSNGNHGGHSNIKWFQAARLVTTPSPPSRRQSKASLRYSQGGSKSKSSAGTPASSSDVETQPSSASTATPTSATTPLGHFERHYIQLSILGSGEFSEAVKASSVSSGQVYAIKRMKRPFTGPRDRLRHLEEVDILRHLGSHPNVISLHEAWEQDAHLYIAAELCPLGTLALFLEGYGYLVGHLDEPRLWKVLVELSAGLAHIHESGVLHLDLKPANVFITAVGTLKIGDFGLASRWPPREARDVLKGAGVDANETEAGELTSLNNLTAKPTTRINLEREGDREYLAPEIISRGHYSRAADVFSLGLIMVEAVGNVILPDNGEPWQKLRRDDLSDVDFEGISVCMVRAIKRMLSSNPEERPDVGEMLRGHEVMGAVRERMARGLKREELDQLPDFEEEDEEEGEAQGEGNRRSTSASKLSALMAVRGALVHEDDNFLAEVLAADPDPEAREMTPAKGAGLGCESPGEYEHDVAHGGGAGGLLLSTTWEEEEEDADGSALLARHFADETFEESQDTEEGDSSFQQTQDSHFMTATEGEEEEGMDLDEA